MRLKLTIAYDGHPYSGWQIQPNATTVQELIQQAISEIAKTPVTITGAGRTDTGVHALGQVAHFDAPEGIDMNPYNWLPAINTKLPPTIRILDCQEIPADFHARFSATAKTYHYNLDLSPVLSPLLAHRAWHLPRQLDPDTLQEALSHYLGEHDFRAFAANRGNETPDTDYLRTITKAELTKHDTGYLITYQGNGFLYKMVRLLTGAAVQTAQGRILIDAHHQLLDQAPHLPHGKSPFCAPAAGLTLIKSHYD